MAGRSKPVQKTMRSALALACRAPSVHNSQPWRWKLTEHSVHLYADRSRLPPALDPTGRELMMSCGAVLHHARVAFAAEGWRTLVQRFPDPAHPDHLASIQFTGMPEADSTAVVLAHVAKNRRTDRRPFLPDPIPEEALTALREAAEAEGCTLTLFAEGDAPRLELEFALEHAGSETRARPEYQEELAAWSAHHASGAEVLACSIPAEYPRGREGRDISPAAEGELPVPVLDDGAMLAVLSTRDDGPRVWLAVGEALSAVLLAAEREGLATCPLSQIGEVATLHEQVREQVLGGVGEPQLTLRFGWPVTGEFPQPSTPRRPLSESLEELFVQ